MTIIAESLQRHQKTAIYCFSFLPLAGQAFEESGHHNYGGDGEAELGDGLGVGEAVEREEYVEDPQRGNLEDYLAQYGEYERLAPHAYGLEHADREEVDAHERSRYAHAAQEM